MLGATAGGWRLAAAVATLPAGAYAQHSQLALESIGPAGGNGAAPADVVGSRDAGKRVFLTTTEPLGAADTDSSLDLYAHTGGTTTLLSRAPPGETGRSRPTRAPPSTGTRAVFQTDERLVGTDTDSSLDVYMREGSTTTLVSTGTGAAPTAPSTPCFRGPRRTARTSSS